MYFDIGWFTEHLCASGISPSFHSKQHFQHQMQYYPTIQYYLWFLQITQQTDKYMLLYAFNAGNFYWVDNHEYLHFPLISISTLFAVKEAMSFLCFSMTMCFSFTWFVWFFPFFLCGFFGFVLFYFMYLFYSLLDFCVMYC